MLGWFAQLLSSVSTPVIHRCEPTVNIHVWSRMLASITSRSERCAAGSGIQDIRQRPPNQVPRIYHRVIDTFSSSPSLDLFAQDPEAVERRDRVLECEPVDRLPAVDGLLEVENPPAVLKELEEFPRLPSSL